MKLMKCQMCKSSTQHKCTQQSSDSLFQFVFGLEQLLNLAPALLLLHHQGVDMILQLPKLRQSDLNVFA